MDWKDKLARYDQIVALAGLKRLGKTMPYTGANTYMHSLFSKAGEMGIRLSQADREAYIAEHGDSPFVTYNTVMKEYVLIHEALLAEPEKVADLLKKSLAYVNCLKPQPRKKKK